MAGGVLHTVALCHGHGGVSLCDCMDRSVCMCVTLCFIVGRSYRIKNTEILLSMNNIEICLTTA